MNAAIQVADFNRSWITDLTGPHYPGHDPAGELFLSGAKKAIRGVAPRPYRCQEAPPKAPFVPGSDRGVPPLTDTMKS